MPNENLIPCPYCGGQPVLNKGKHPTLNKSVYFYKCCNWRCKLSPATSNYDKKSQAISNWNNKIITTTLPENV